MVIPWKEIRGGDVGLSDLCLVLGVQEGPNGRGRLRPSLSRRPLGLTVDIQPMDFFSKQIYHPKYIYPR